MTRGGVGWSHVMGGGRHVARESACEVTRKVENALNHWLPQYCYPFFLTDDY